jgi:hypothetical protein
VARDERTEAIFTTADDQMQGLWGFHRYVQAATDITKPDALLHRLPQDMFQLTHEWGRFYDPKEMADRVGQMREFLLCRQSLLGLVSVCEAALLRLNRHLASTNTCAEVSGNKKLLVWAFTVVQKSPVASPEATVRLPKTCGDLDNARRLRNCIVHRNGCYDEEMYLRQIVQDGWVIPQFEKNSQNAATKGEPIFLTTGRFEYLTRSHIEFLHILHNTIQQQEFGHPVPYNYTDEGKRIEWHRILSGRRVVKM